MRQREHISHLCLTKGLSALRNGNIPHQSERTDFSFNESLSSRKLSFINQGPNPKQKPTRSL